MKVCVLMPVFPKCLVWVCHLFCVVVNVILLMTVVLQWEGEGWPVCC